MSYKLYFDKDSKRILTGEIARLNDKYFNDPSCVAKLHLGTGYGGYNVLLLGKNPDSGIYREVTSGHSPARDVCVDLWLSDSLGDLALLSKEYTHRK